jgi:hypothetical protein
MKAAQHCATEDTVDAEKEAMIIVVTRFAANFLTLS